MDEISSLAKEIAAKEFSDPHQPKHQLGPDYVLPSNEFRIWDKDGAVRIDYEENDDELQKLESVVSFLRSTAHQYPHDIALSVKRDDSLVTWNYIQYWNDVCAAAKGFIKLGLLPFHGVCMLGFNAPEWLISYLAAIVAGGFSAGIYTTNSAEACFHILNDSSANIVVVENEAQLKKILQIRDRLPNLKAIVQYIGKPAHEDVLSWNDLMHIGKSVPEDVLERRIKGIAINQCCSIIYTSGTTGNSKGVMLSHDNVLVMVKLGSRDYLKYKLNSTLVSYLPLSHVAAMICDIYVPIFIRGNLHFISADALKGKMTDALKEIKPNGFFGVPRVFEKIHENMQEVENNMIASKRLLFKWAQRQALKYYENPTNNSDLNRFLFSLAKKLVLNKIIAELGFQNLTVLFGGGAPLSSSVHNYFTSINMPILEMYGMSEASGLHVANSIEDRRIGSVGIPDKRINVFDVKIESPDEDGAGEILLKGRNIFMGYLHLKDYTLTTIDDERWLHTGDIGKIDSDGFLFITGRIKELIITAGGENIPPILIEDVIKNLTPAIANCVLIGDKRKFLTMLVTLKSEINPQTTLPLDQLTQSVIKWCRSLGSTASSVTEILNREDKAVMAAIQRSIDEYNKKHAISNAQRIQKWKILPRDFTMQGGELGPTAKLRRPFIEQKYSDVIEQMYSETQT